jgi:hypothetical protein
MKTFGALLITSTLAVSCSGCAFLFKGLAGEATSKTFHVESSPSEANVTVDGVSYGRTPTDVSLPRDHGVTIVVTKDGYQEGDLTPKRHPDMPWVLWDWGTCVVLLCLITVTADAASGAWSTYSGDQVSVQLKPSVGGGPPFPGSSRRDGPPEPLGQ